MEKWQIVCAIIAVAVVTAFLYALGLKKSLNQNDRLMAKLYQKGSDKVLAYLKANDTVSIKEIREIVSSVSTGEFYSKKRAVVTDSEQFASNLTHKMVLRGFIEPVSANKYRRKR